MDIGTGSGCIPVALKKNLPGAQIYACDVSNKALDLAKKNAVLNHAEVHFFEANVLLEKEMLEEQGNKFDLIVSNPPYIKESEKAQMEKNVLEHEPHLALFVEDEDAIIFYKKIIDLCPASLNKKGKLYFELNPLTAKAVDHYAGETKQFSTTELIKDMSGTLRFFKAIRK